MTKLALTLWVLAAACSKKYEPSAEDKKLEAEQAAASKRDTPAAPAKKKKAGPPADLGSCKLEVTGALTAEQTSPGGKDATNVAYWYTADERKNMMGVDGYVVNCKGDKFRFSLLPGGGKLDGMPFAPKTFTFVKGKSDGASVMMAAGKDTLYASALKGKGAMPAKGGNAALDEAALKAAVDHMIAAAK